MLGCACLHVALHRTFYEELPSSLKVDMDSVYKMITMPLAELFLRLVAGVNSSSCIWVALLMNHLRLSFKEIIGFLLCHCNTKTERAEDSPCSQLFLWKK